MPIRHKTAILNKYNKKHGANITTLPELIETISPVKTVEATGCRIIRPTDPAIHKYADDKLFAYLLKKGVCLNQTNKDALSKLNGLLLAQIEGSHTGKYQVDLPAGFGKTSAMKCIIATIHELKLPYSIGISLERIDQIDEIYDELINEMGLPEDVVARVHSGSSIPQTNEYYSSLKDCQFLIFTQAKLKAAQFVDTYYMYRDPSTGSSGLRNLLIWDESLISSLMFSAHYSDVIKMVDNAITDLTDSTTHHLMNSSQRKTCDKVLRFLRGFREFLQLHKDDDFSTPHNINVDVERLKNVTPADINTLPIKDDRIKDILRIYSGNKGSNFLRGGLDGLNKKVALTFKEILPPELTNITVLDASASFRVVTRLDQSFIFYKIPREVSYSGSIAFLYDYNSGGTDIKNAFMYRRARNRNIGYNEFEHFACVTADNIFTADPNAHVLLSSYKGIIGPLERNVNAHLKKSKAVDVNKGELMPITYGMETASNEYRDCQYIIEVGTFQTPDFAIDNMIAGQLGEGAFPFCRKLTSMAESCSICHRRPELLKNISCSTYQVVEHSGPSSTKELTA